MRVKGRFLIVMVSLLGAVALHATPDTDEPREELKLQVNRELDELQAQKRRGISDYELLQSKAEAASRDTQQAMDTYESIRRSNGENSPEAKKAAKALAKARENFYALLNQRDRTLYQINLTQKGIADREYLLGSRSKSSH